MKHRLGIVLVTGLLMAACGSGDSESEADDEPAAAADDPSSEEAPDDTPENDSDGDVDATNTDTDDGDANDDGDTDESEGPTDDDMDDTDDGNTDDGNTDDGDTDDDDTIVVTSFDDIPDECIDLMGQFLREIEPQVSSIDWQTATIDELDAMGDSIEAPGIAFDEASAATGCDKYTIGVDDDQSIQFAIEVAQREAPGTVGWLEFIATFTGIGDGSDTGSADGGSASDEVPGDCAGMLDFLRDIAAEYGTISEVPIAEFGPLSTLLGDMTSTCTLAELDEFASDPVISAFLEG